MATHNSMAYATNFIQKLRAMMLLSRPVPKRVPPWWNLETKQIVTYYHLSGDHLGKGRNAFTTDDFEILICKITCCTMFITLHGFCWTVFIMTFSYLQDLDWCKRQKKREEVWHFRTQNCVDIMTLRIFPQICLPEWWHRFCLGLCRRQTVI